MKDLLIVDVKLIAGTVEEGQGQEKIVYPSIDTWLFESFRDQLKSALYDGHVLGKVRIEVTKD